MNPSDGRVVWFKVWEGSRWFINKDRNWIEMPMHYKHALYTRSKHDLDLWVSQNVISNFQYIEGLEMLKQLKKKRKK